MLNKGEANMLKNLFISKVRVRILHKYMLDINKAYHTRGLVRELGEEINAIRRELINLKKAGLLTTSKDGNKIMYKIDKSNPIVLDLRSMFFKESKTGKLLYEHLLPVENIQLVLVTEAFLKKKYDSQNDIDILFIGTMKIRELSSAISSIEKELGRSIKYVAMKVEDFEFGKKKRDPILMNTLAKDKILLIGRESDLL
jgi:DNA-binding transcriptional ArsR family regulator